MIVENAYLLSLCHQHNSCSFDQIFFNLTYKIGLKLGGRIDHELIQRILFCD